MREEEIKEKYKTLIIPESREPFNFGKMENSLEVEAYNPFCGDKYKLYLNLDAGHRIQSLHFDGHGCALSKASTSLLCREMEGQEIKKAMELLDLFLKAVDEGISLTEFPDALKILTELKSLEGRTDCIRLSWDAMNAYIEKNLEKG